jgi:CheY-like chemotaxis protein
VRRVLVVEDNPVNAFVALKQLTALGFAGSAVAWGGEAVNAIKTQTFDIILMDCGLPDIDGFDTARIIRDFEQGSPNGRRIPIIAVTLENGDDTLDKCISAGMDAHLPKPTSITELRDTLERLST